MEAKSLMIGDWVNCSNNPQRIKGAIDFTIAKDFEPIPLTAEILEKNFPKADNVAWWYADDYEDTDDRITYEIHISGGAIGINGFVWYVHELQHALRLCGLNDLADNFKI